MIDVADIFTVCWSLAPDPDEDFKEVGIDRDTVVVMVDSFKDRIVLQELDAEGVLLVTAKLGPADIEVVATVLEIACGCEIAIC